MVHIFKSNNRYLWYHLSKQILSYIGTQLTFEDLFFSVFNFAFWWSDFICKFIYIHIFLTLLFLCMYMKASSLVFLRDSSCVNKVFSASLYDSYGFSWALFLLNDCFVVLRCVSFCYITLYFILFYFISLLSLIDFWWKKEKKVNPEGKRVGEELEVAEEEETNHYVLCF